MKENASRPQAKTASVQLVMHSRHPKRAGADVATRVNVHMPCFVRTGDRWCTAPRDPRILRRERGRVNIKSVSGCALRCCEDERRARATDGCRQQPGPPFRVGANVRSVKRQRYGRQHIQTIGGTTDPMHTHDRRVIGRIQSTATPASHTNVRFAKRQSDG